MVIIEALNKPYTEKQKLEFIVKQNHRNGYKIKETETALEAWGLTEEEKNEHDKKIEKRNIMAQLNAIDLKTIRALRSIGINANEEDRLKLAELEKQAIELRNNLKDIEGITE